MVLFLTAASSPHTSSPITCYDPIEHARKREQKFNELLESSNLDLNDLRKLAWKGIPSSYRAIVWQILMGYLPTNKERRGSMLARKRQEYLDIVKQHYKDKGLLATDPIYRQVFCAFLKTGHISFCPVYPYRYPSIFPEPAPTLHCLRAILSGRASPKSCTAGQQGDLLVVMCKESMTL